MRNPLRFLTSAHNSLSQRLWIELGALGHKIRVCVVATDEAMIAAVSREVPDLIIAPMLKIAIPREVWSRHLCLIVHPGIKGDRGPASLDWAIANHEKIWGVTILEAADEFDAGPIWASHEFVLEADPPAKSSLYRGQVTEAALRGVLEAVARIESGEFRSGSWRPEKLSDVSPQGSPLCAAVCARRCGRPTVPSTGREIAYHQGVSGDIYITEILVTLEMFNCERFDKKRHPHYLLNRTKSALDFYQKDFEAHPSPLDILVPKLPEILERADLIKKETPAAAKHVGFEFGRMKVGKTKGRAGSQNHRNIRLPFLDTQMTYHVPNGWLYPMLAAFRANVDWNLERRKFEWKVPLCEQVPQVINDLVRVCVTEHREDRLRFLVLAKVRQQQEHPGKTFLTRIEQPIDEVCLDADRPIQKMGNEHLGERWFLLNHAENSR